MTKIKRVHFVGIGGSGVSGVEKLTKEMGYQVTGCDLETGGHDIKHIKGVDLVVVSPALFYQNSKHPEILEAQKKGILMTWQKFLGTILLKNKKLICIAGTHGKSTTTAMVGKLLIDNGFDPIVVLGAKVPEWDGNSRNGRGKYAVVEADEFNNNFLHYHPDIAIINNIEFDHPDFFKNEKEVKESFEKFTKNLVGEKILITEKDNLKKKFKLQILGKHNQKNANMVYVLGKKLGIKDENIIKSIESFTGIGRRTELIGERNGIKVYSDYAHHPTAIKTTLEGLREKFPKAKILAVVEPHGYKRTKALLPNYKNVFKAADDVIIGPIFVARDEIDESITPQKVAEVSNHKNALGVDSFGNLIGNWKTLLASPVKIGNYDVVIVMGAGKSDEWAREILNILPIKFSDITAFKIGGKIKKYFEVRDIKEIETALNFATENNFQIFIIGDGTDILVSDKDFSGVVIKYIGDEILINDDGTVIAEAGVNWDKLVEKTVAKDFQGIECLSGIPGTVGAAPIQNIGAYGQELADTFLSLKAYSIGERKFVTFYKEDCQFGYRESIFKKKQKWQKYIIISVTLRLHKNKKPEIKYDSLKNYLQENKIKIPTLSDVRNAVLAIRSTKFEDPKVVGNAGSFFKNPIVNIKIKDDLEKKYPDIKTFSFEDKYKIAAGWLIEKAGWKGKVHKTAAVSANHALVLINPQGTSKAKDIFDLSEKIINDVYKKFSIKLEREVQLINFI